MLETAMTVKSLPIPSHIYASNINDLLGGRSRLTELSSLPAFINTHYWTNSELNPSSCSDSYVRRPCWIEFYTDPAMLNWLNWYHHLAPESCMSASVGWCRNMEDPPDPIRSDKVYCGTTDFFMAFLLPNRSLQIKVVTSEQLSITRPHPLFI